MGSIEKKVMFQPKYSLGRNNTIAKLFHTQYTPDFLKAEYCGLWNTIFWVTKDLAFDQGYTGYPVSRIIRPFLVYGRIPDLTCRISCRIPDNENSWISGQIEEITISIKKFPNMSSWNSYRTALK